MTPPGAPSRVGVLDVGSNSVRLVIFEIHGAAAIPVFNEKTMAGLGRGLSETGVLSDAAMEAALAVLRRFSAILSALEIEQVVPVATAAVRRAANGEAFARKAEMVLGAPLRVLPGAEEARLAALGVAAGQHRPDGLVGDLGGSSLELQPAQPVPGAEPETHMLGPFALDDGTGFDEARVRAAAREALEQSALLKAGHQRLYLVGGAWRAIAKLQMALRSYPLQVLQGHTIRAKEVRKAVKAVLSSSSDAEIRAKVAAAAKSRLAALPFAAVALGELIDVGGIEDVVVSSTGLREGVVRDLIGPRDTDPLLDGAAAYARLDLNQKAFGERLYGFVAPALAPEPDLFGSLDADERIDRAACLLADIGGRFHPDHRASMAFDQVLRAPFVAVTHPERVFVASAIGRRYARSFAAPAELDGLLSEAQKTRAERLGACMRLGAAFSGRSARILREAALDRTKRALVLNVAARSRAMVSDTVERRLAQAADAFGLAFEVRSV